MNEDDDNIKISMEEEQKNVEYQETLKVDVKNISKINKYEDQYMKLLMLNFSNKQIFSHNILKTYVKITQINLSLNHMMPKYS